MRTFFVLGRHFADDHDRAIRFIDPPSKTKQASLGIALENKVKTEWCDKCNAWHLTRESNVQVRNGLAAS